MVAKFINDFLSVSISLIAIDNPIPKIGPINGEINMAPITTAVESALRPIDATKIEQTKIQAVAPLNEISAFMAVIVASLSVSSLKSRSSLKNVFTLANKPCASFLIASFFSSTALSLFISLVIRCSSSSEKLNLFSSLMVLKSEFRWIYL